MDIKMQPYYLISDGEDLFGLFDDKHELLIKWTADDGFTEDLMTLGRILNFLYEVEVPSWLENKHGLVTKLEKAFDDET
jgi:hypothetical protein